MTYPDNYTTPMIIVCSDPGSTEQDDPLIEVNQEEGYEVSGLPPVKKFKTMFKVQSTVVSVI